MRRLGLLLVLTACTPGNGDSSTDVDLGTSTSYEGTTLHGIQTVTGETMDLDTGVTTAPSSSGESTDPTTRPASGTTTDDGDTSGSSGTTSVTEAVCGNGILEGDEGCDDGNDIATDECTNDCRPPGCGDAILHPGEVCDDGNKDDFDACTNACEEAACGDGKVWLDMEDCDDANAVDSDDCLSNCKTARCGDGKLWANHEICDDGFNENDYGGCAADCQAKADEYCGDGDVQQAWEHCDGPTGMIGVGCKGCLFDFASVPQMSCAKTCSWAGPGGCGQEDADVFCKLRTGNKLAKATSFKLVAPTDSAGFPCSDPKVFFDPDLRKPLGLLPEFGVQKAVYYQESMIASTHGTAQVIQGSSLICAK